MVTHHVYTIAGAKGGVGKTTTSINLGTLLVEAGYSTVVVEMDLTMPNVAEFLDIDIDTDEDVTLHDVLASDTSVTDAMYETDEGLSVVPGGSTCDGDAHMNLDRLPDIVEALWWHHDVVLLDTPAGRSEETVKSLQLADGVLLISTPHVASMRNVSNTTDLIAQIDAPVYGLVLTKSGTGADEVAAFPDVELLGHVPEDDAVLHSQDIATPVVVNAPHSDAAIAYRKISRQLVDTTAGHAMRDNSASVTRQRRVSEAETPASEDRPEPVDETAVDSSPEKADIPVSDSTDERDEPVSLTDIDELFFDVTDRNSHTTDNAVVDEGKPDESGTPVGNTPDDYPSDNESDTDDASGEPETDDFGARIESLFDL
ncbi:MAG: P-loop NTPase [Haloarcula sp.]